MSDFAPASVLPKFDQVVQGNVDIKQLSKKKYKITFSKIRKFLLYQTWSDSSQQLNEDRKVFYQNAKLWIKNFNGLNDSLKKSNEPLFTPTVVMEIGSNKYLFVINQAKLNGKGCVVFKVSTKEIKSSDKKILKLPHGHHDGVRFDIDYGRLPNLCGSDTFCSCSEILQYQQSTYGFNCQPNTCTPASQSYACLYANIGGCGTYYQWSNSTANILSNLTTTSYCPEN